MKRPNIKVYENVAAIYLQIDKETQKITSKNENFITSAFRKYTVENIIYDEQMLCCFFFDHDHPFKHKFGKELLDFFKAFAHQNFVVLHEKTVDNIVHVAIFEADKIKTFKE